MIVALLAVLASAAWPAATSQPIGSTCQRRCGGVDIPYPFGIGRGCYLYTGENDLTFGLTCNLTATGATAPFCGGLEVLSVSVPRGQARVRNNITTWCYNATSRAMDSQSDNLWTDVSDSSFMLSDQENRFTVVGCNSLAYVSSLDTSQFSTGSDYMTGCMATCPGAAARQLENGSCAGMGCCQAAIPRGINSYGVVFEDKFNTSQMKNLSRCSYAALVEATAFDFRATYVTVAGNFVESTGGAVPLVLDWVVGKETCGEAKRNASAYACVSGNSVCVDSRNGPGYLCNCSRGFEGNPYLQGGCRGRNNRLRQLRKETAAREEISWDTNVRATDRATDGKREILTSAREPSNPCSVPCACINTPGGFTCACPDETTGNAYTGTCEAKKSQLGVHIAVGVSVSVVVLVISMSCAYMIHEKRSLATVKRRYFKQHGGLLLFEEMKPKQGISFTLFTREELEEATGKFDERNVLGKGGNGTVYKGTLKDGRTVAIKRCKLVDERQKKEFGKEMLILSQINHRNVVKLYGCCLEVEVPMLVYEFIPNGTLYQLIHGDRHHHGAHVSLATRLKIAHETAEALAYLHSWASPAIIHGDVKSPNILIDDNHTVKVSDFGASTLAPTDEAQFVTFVQGTCGYLDPEYMQTCKLTDKSDVYSFGVVLLELLTRRKALNLQATEGEEKNLSSRFLLAASARRLDEIVDAQIVNEQSVEPIQQVAELAKECLAMNSEKRPSTREIAEELGRLRKLLHHPWGQRSSDREMEGLLGGSGSPTTSAYSDIELSNAYVSLDDSAYLGVQSPR